MSGHCTVSNPGAAEELNIGSLVGCKETVFDPKLGCLVGSSQCPSLMSEAPLSLGQEWRYFTLANPLFPRVEAVISWCFYTELGDAPSVGFPEGYSADAKFVNAQRVG